MRTQQLTSVVALCHSNSHPLLTLVASTQGAGTKSGPLRYAILYPNAERSEPVVIPVRDSCRHPGNFEPLAVETIPVAVSLAEQRRRELETRRTRLRSRRRGRRAILAVIYLDDVRAIHLGHYLSTDIA